jgi:SPP1 gp7 family putative phage head morphogenesis protein
MPVKPQEAIAYFRAKTPLEKDAWLALDEEQRERAFTVAGLANARLLQDAIDHIESAMNNGDSYEDFADAIRDTLISGWGGEIPGRIETIFRTNVMTAFSRGHYLTMTDPDVLDDRPYWRFDAVPDSVITDECRACDGVILPASDPWWQSHYPPLHYRCRSTVTALTREQAEREGITASPPSVKVMDGFGRAPTGLPTMPDVSTLHPKIAQMVMR